MSDITISIKSSGDTKFELTVSPSSTVLQLKESIEEKSSVPADSQRLIYSGKVLKDSQTIESYKVQNGHTIHMVKSAKKPTDTAAASSAATASNSTTSEASGVPSNIAAGQGAFNPLADLTSARYAGYTQLPDASMFGPDGGMNNGMPDMDRMTQMMSDPAFLESMSSILDNPQMLDHLINSNPQLRAMGPQSRQMLQSPFFRQMLTNPEMLRSMMEMQGMMGGNSTFQAPGANPTVGATGGDASTSEGNNNAAAGTGAGAAPNFDFANMLLGGGFPPAPSVPSAPADNRPPEERYESQLRQLNDMGFFDFDRNVQALRRTGGSVQGAIEYLLGGN